VGCLFTAAVNLVGRAIDSNGGGGTVSDRLRDDVWRLVVLSYSLESIAEEALPNPSRICKGTFSRFWEFLGDFSLISSIFRIFGGHFSTFRHFSSSDTRQTNGSVSR
jgi:hypothetical protein